jgi:hypothetical protein
MYGSCMGDMGVENVTSHFEIQQFKIFSWKLAAESSSLI